MRLFIVLRYNKSHRLKKGGEPIERKKEVGELRRRFRPEKSSVTHVQGCYVSEQGRWSPQFDQSLALMPQEEGGEPAGPAAEDLVRQPGPEPLNLSFSTAQVVDSPEHKLLMACGTRSCRTGPRWRRSSKPWPRASGWKGGYLILLAYDCYDVPYRAKDGGSLEDLWKRCTPTFCVAFAR